jgi:hypothetical protein
MVKACCCVVVLTLVPLARPGYAQEHRGEVSILAGWAFSEGVTGDSVVTPDGVFTRVDPKR